MEEKKISVIYDYIIQLAGWFFFGSFIVFVNEMMLIFDDITDDSRSRKPSGLTDW